jgi:hypothetical protein
MKDKHRLSVDLTDSQHIQLRMMAAKKNMTVREYVIEALAFKESIDSQSQDCPVSEFRDALAEIIKKRANLIRDLAKS